MKIEIVFINGINKSFVFDKNSQIKNLKQDIINSGLDELSNIDNAVCILKFKGIDLDDELSLLDYNVEESNRIHFLVRSQPINIIKDSPTVYESISSSPHIGKQPINIVKKDKETEILSILTLISERLNNVENEIKYLTKCVEEKETEKLIFE